jgi:addiction module HigA family antidote
MTQYLHNPHPGEILQQEFLEPLGLSQNALAQAIGVPANRINEIIRGRRGITADTDLRLARFFKLSEGYLLQMSRALRSGAHVPMGTLRSVSRSHDIFASCNFLN